MVAALTTGSFQDAKAAVIAALPNTGAEAMTRAPLFPDNRSLASQLVFRFGASHPAEVVALLQQIDERVTLALTISDAYGMTLAHRVAFDMGPEAPKHAAAFFESAHARIPFNAKNKMGFTVAMMVAEHLGEAAPELAGKVLAHWAGRMDTAATNLAGKSLGDYIEANIRRRHPALAGGGLE